MTKNVTFRGEFVTVNLKGLGVGDTMPNFKAVKTDLSDFNLYDYKDKILVINTFPSVDTGICALQTIKFNNEMKHYPNVQVLTVSKDLPFALGRFCGDKGIENAITVSDYRYRDFEAQFGGNIEELALLSRQVIVVDKDLNIVYYELCENTNAEPNYDNALDIIKSLQ